jgi:MFS family permease
VTSRGTESQSTGEAVPRADEPLWRHRDYRIYWSASLISSAGSALTYVALPLPVFGLTGSTVLTGLVVTLEAVAYLTFGLFAGVLADRVRRRRIMVLADCVNAALLFKVLSVPSVLALDALSFAASALLLRALHTTLTGARDSTAPARTWRDLLVGLRFV